MGKISLTGLVTVVILFIVISSWLMSKVTVGNAAVAIPGFPDSTQPLSLLDAIARNIVQWIRGLLS